MRPFTLRTVVMATDLTEAALPALRAATELARLSGAELHVVHALERDLLEAERALEAQLRQIEGRYSVPYYTNAVPGDPARVIVENASRVDADVVVLGPHRTGGAYPVGGTAYVVAATAQRPCLAMRGELNLPLGRLLVPVDASDAARGALAVALTWGSALRRRSAAGPAGRTEIVALHVNLPGDDAAVAEGAVLRATVSEVRDRIAAVAGVDVESVERGGEAVARTIVEMANADGFDLLVVGTRALLGESGELGSVASEVVGRCNCPVLLVPPAVWQAEAGEVFH